MQNLRDMIGLPVLETETGLQIGEVQEVVLNLDKAIVYGIVVSGANWFSENRGIEFRDLFSIGRSAVTVRSSSAVREFTSMMDSPEVLKLSDICDKQVYTETGDYLGALVDIVCDPATGEVRFFELSDGFVTDFLYGRLTMPLPQAQVISEDKMIVPAVMARLLHAANQEPGGVT